MKFTKRLFLAFLLLCLPLAPVGWTGMTCGNPTVQKATYNTLASVGAAVDQAYAAWNDQVVKGTGTFNSTVAGKYNTFQKAYAVAVDAASTNVNALAPADLVSLANDTITLIHQFTK